MADDRFKAGEVVFFQGHRVIIIAYAMNHARITYGGEVPKEIVLIEFEASNPKKRMEVCEETLVKINR